MTIVSTVLRICCLLVVGCALGHGKTEGGLPVLVDLSLSTNPVNASEICLTVDPDIPKYACPPGYRFAESVKRLFKMQCVPRGKPESRFRKNIRECAAERMRGIGKYQAREFQPPVCVNAPEECVLNGQDDNARQVRITSYLRSYESRCERDRPDSTKAIPFPEEKYKYRNEIFFKLYASSTNFTEKQIHMDRLDDLMTGGFVEGAPTKIICHGYTSSSNDTVGPALHKAYIERYRKTLEPINIILVDWSALSGFGNNNQSFYQTITNWWKTSSDYGVPREMIWDVGQYTADLVQYLKTCGQTTLDKIHLIGHSLGAHAMGNAGKYFNTLKQGKIGRLTALDAAAPCYEISDWLLCHSEGPKYKSVGKEDAVFVDAIHTNGHFKGVRAAVGHADFYVNGGDCQPGCWTCLKISACSHMRAYELMADSITAPADNFRSIGCNSPDDALKDTCDLEERANMGEYCDHTTSGIFSVKTNWRRPFTGLPIETTARPKGFWSWFG